MSSLQPRLFLCTKCFKLTSKGETTQACDCEPWIAVQGLDCPRGFHLCYVCSVSVVGGTSRWAWEACQNCLAANSFVKAKTGKSLKLGRHSVMNGIIFPIQISKSDSKKAAESLIAFSNEMIELERLADMRVERSFKSIFSWRCLNSVPIDAWIKRFNMNENSHFDRSIELIEELTNLVSN